MLRLPQFLHLHLVSNTIMLCNKCKKKQFHDGRRRIDGTSSLSTSGKIPRSPESYFVFLPRQAFIELSLPVTECIAKQNFYYQLPLKSVVLLGSAISRVLSSHFSVATVLVSTSSHCFLQWQYYKDRASIRNKNLSYLSTTCSANFRQNIAWDFIQLTN